MANDEPSPIGSWRPPVSHGQMRIVNLKQRPDLDAPVAALVCGPRVVGKTIAIEHLICHHLWNHPGAKVCIVAETIKNATDAGIWKDMIQEVVPKWIESGIGFEYRSKGKDGVMGPKTDSATKSHYFEVSNKLGGNSELRLISLDKDADTPAIEAIFKGARFTLIWISELSHYSNPEVFTQSRLALRSFSIAPRDRIWIADTNPSEEGTESWIYKLFYIERLNKNHTKPAVRDSMQLFELTRKDNPKASADDYAFVESQYAGDPFGYARNVKGEWIGGVTKSDKLFADLFNRSLHVVGESDEESMEVSPLTTQILGSWDLGSSMNSAAHMLERRIIGGRSYWYVHNEHVSLDDQVSTWDFTLGYIAKTALLESAENRTFDWMHWSDSSATDMWRAAFGGYDYQIVMAASNGKIVLHGAAKPEGSVVDRVRLLRLLLRERRIFISSRCHHTIAMLENCRKGKNKPVAEDRYKHAFDSLTYAIYMEMIDDFLFTDSQPTVRKSTLVSIA